MSEKQVSIDCLKQDAFLISFFFFHSFTFVNSAFSASFNNSCIFQILLQYMSNYVNFKLLGKALEQTKSYKNQQIDRNFYSYLKKIGLPVFVLKTRCSMKKINSTSLLYCLHEANCISSGCKVPLEGFFRNTLVFHALTLRTDWNVVNPTEIFLQNHALDLIWLWK